MECIEMDVKVGILFQNLGGRQNMVLSLRQRA